MSDEQSKVTGDPFVEQDDYRRGFEAGYSARCREEVESYLRVVESGRQVYDNVIRDLINLPSAAERKAQREAILREAHAAELHAGRPAYGCPVCAEARHAAARTVAQEACGPIEGGGWRCKPWARCTHDGGCLLDDGESDRHHSGHYGAPLIDGTGITSTMIDLSGRRGASCPVNGLAGYACPCTLDLRRGIVVDAEAGCPMNHRRGDRVELRPVAGLSRLAPDHSPGAASVLPGLVCEIPGHCYNSPPVLADPECRCGTVSDCPVHPGGPGQPAPCKAHAGEGNQLNCGDCGRRRQAFYARLGGQ